jgi:flagellar protein FliS
MITANRHTNAYAVVGLETGVAAANPHKLVLMLFEGALVSLADARKYMQQKDIAKKGKSISKAIQIIDEGLKLSLDDKAGGVIAANLKELYDYMCRRLLFAHVRNEIDPINEVHGLLSQLKEAWQAIGTQHAPIVNNAPSVERTANYARV